MKVLDFSLAKAMDPASNLRPDLTNSPTITSPAMIDELRRLAPVTKR